MYQSFFVLSRHIFNHLGSTLYSTQCAEFRLVNKKLITIKVNMKKKKHFFVILKVKITTSVETRRVIRNLD